MKRILIASTILATAIPACGGGGSSSDPLEGVNSILILQRARRAAGGVAGVATTTVAVLPDGNCLVAGFFKGTATFEGTATTLTSAGGNDIFLASYSAGGSFLWARRAGGTGTDDVLDFAGYPDGSFAITGYFNDTAVFVEVGEDDGA